MTNSITEHFFSPKTAKSKHIHTKQPLAKVFSKPKNHAQENAALSAKIFDKPKNSSKGNFASLDNTGIVALIGENWKPKDFQKSLIHTMVNDTQLLAVTQKFNAGNVNRNILSKALTQAETQIQIPQKEKYSHTTEALKTLNAKPTLTEKDKVALSQTLKTMELDHVLSTADLPKLFAEPK